MTGLRKAIGACSLVKVPVLCKIFTLAMFSSFFVEQCRQPVIYPMGPLGQNMAVDIRQIILSYWEDSTIHQFHSEAKLSIFSPEAVNRGLKMLLLELVGAGVQRESTMEKPEGPEPKSRRYFYPEGFKKRHSRRRTSAPFIGAACPPHSPRQCGQHWPLRKTGTLQLAAGQRCEKH